MIRLAPISLAAVAACATLGEPAPAPSGPPPFEGVKTLALARWSEDPAARRPRDALDGLKDSLDARGYATRVVEVGPRMPPGAELRDLARLYEQVRSRVASGTSRAAVGWPVESAGPQAGAVVAALGVDAIALYHRFDERSFPVLAEPPLLPGTLYGAPRTVPPPPRRPLGALSLVDRRGSVVSFAWGAPDAPGAQVDLGAPVNAAEAVDDVMRVLSGDLEQP